MENHKDCEEEIRMDVEGKIRPDGVAFGDGGFKKSKQDGGMRGGRSWFTIEAKSYEISVEGVGKEETVFHYEKK